MLISGQGAETIAELVAPSDPGSPTEPDTPENMEQEQEVEPPVSQDTSASKDSFSWCVDKPASQAREVARRDSSEPIPGVTGTPRTPLVAWKASEYSAWSAIYCGRCMEEGRGEPITKKSKSRRDGKEGIMGFVR